ncbi:uncharacterized protein LOC135383436 isoform X1 [Ornithodoros turicata]|uniref:uncharacterized protein LOC135383436 isoform X1 n=1 Tax=Ornithodoros turicata TaxID=34597 RepID=UPI00313890E4
MHCGKLWARNMKIAGCALIMIVVMTVTTSEDLCKVDPRTGMFHATAIGRATNRFFGKCWLNLKDMHRKLDSRMVVAIADYACENADFCVAKVGEEDIPAFCECMFDFFVANWTYRDEFDEHDRQAMRRSLACMIPVLPNKEVLLHLNLYARKIVG